MSCGSWPTHLTKLEIERPLRQDWIAQVIWARLVGGSGFLNFGLPFLRLLSREGSGALGLTCNLTLQGFSLLLLFFVCISL